MNGYATLPVHFSSFSLWHINFLKKHFFTKNFLMMT